MCNVVCVHVYSLGDFLQNTHTYFSLAAVLDLCMFSKHIFFCNCPSSNPTKPAFPSPGSSSVSTSAYGLSADMN